MKTKRRTAGQNWEFDGSTITVRIPMVWKHRGSRKVIIAPDGGDAWAPAKPRPDETLVRALAWAHRCDRLKTPIVPAAGTALWMRATGSRARARASSVSESWSRRPRGDRSARTPCGWCRLCRSCPCLAARRARRASPGRREHILQTTDLGDIRRRRSLEFLLAEGKSSRIRGIDIGEARRSVCASHPIALQRAEFHLRKHAASPNVQVLAADVADREQAAVPVAGVADTFDMSAVQVLLQPLRRGLAARPSPPTAVLVDASGELPQLTPDLVYSADAAAHGTFSPVHGKTDSKQYHRNSV